MIPEVSAGSNQVGASEIETAQVIWPSGAATAGVAPMAEIRTTSVTAKTTRTILMASASSTAGHVNSGRFRHLPLRLLQPVRHPHLAVHRRRGGEMLLRLFALARAPGELAEAEAAVGRFGTDPQLRRQSESLLERLAGANWILWRKHLSLPASPRWRATARISLGRSRQSYLDLRAGLLIAAGREVGACSDRSVVMPPRRRDPAGSFDRLCQAFQAPLALAEQDKSVGEMGGSPDGREKEIVFSPDRERALEEGYGGHHLAAEAVDIAEVAVSDGETGGVLDVVRHP